MSIPLQGLTIEESHEDDDYNLPSLRWQVIAESSSSFDIFESVIEEFNVVEPENGEDKLPDQLTEAANTILYISLGIKVNYYTILNSFSAKLLTITKNLFFLVGKESQKRI